MRSKNKLKHVVSVLTIVVMGLLSALPGFGSPMAVPMPLSIMEIQGSAQFSAFDGDIVETTGVVTLFNSSGSSFWMQDPDGDGDSSTSDGIYVSGGGFPDVGPVPEVGDHIRIVAEADEQMFGNSLPLTRLRNVELIEVLSSENDLPTPILLKDLPNSMVSDGIDFWEPLEGMLVEVKKARVVAPTNRFGEFGMLTSKDAKPGSGFFPSSQHIIVQGNGSVDYNPERIVVDDSTLENQIVVRPKDQIGHLIGVVDYTFSNYKLQPASIEGVVAHAIPTSPVSRRSSSAHRFAVTTFNVENLFDLVDDPIKDDIGTGGAANAADLETQLAKLALAIEHELRLPEILVVQEVENQAILQELGDRVNSSTGTDYVATGFETSDGRGIEVGFLWDADRVDLLEAFQMSGTAVEDAFGPGSPSPGREPIVGRFNVTGNINADPLWVIGNHFKSKSGDDPVYGVNDPPIRITEVQRKMQAQAVREFVNDVFDTDSDAMLMVIGDLNDFQFAEPGEGSDHPLAILEGGGGEVSLTNLVELERPDERFTFVFDGNSQVLDHILVSPSLMSFKAGQDILHFNAGYPDDLASDPTTALRSSDHDAVEARFRFRPVRAKYTLTILHNNDGESRLINAGSGITDFGGVARFATLVDDLRGEALSGPGKRSVVLLSSGDNFLAGPQFAASLDKGVPFYDTLAMDMIGYDAVAIGNHEFDFGPDVLADFLEGFGGSTPFVSANLDFSAEPVLQVFVDRGVIVSRVVLRDRGETIGIVGATTPMLPFISSPRDVVVAADVAGILQNQIDTLLSQRVNKIVVISHLQDVTDDIDLAGMLSGVDIMIAGGGDELLANPDDLLVPGDDTPFGPYPLYATGVDGAVIPVVTTSGDYKYVGRLMVSFDGKGVLLSVDDRSGPVRVAGGTNPDAVLPDPAIQAQVVDPVQLYVDDLGSVIATSEVALEGRRDPGIRTEETNLGNLVSDSLLWQATQLAGAFGVKVPDVALQNGGGIRNNTLIPAGPITELNTFEIVPFSNFVTILEDIPPAQFKEIMENAVSGAPGASGRFAQIGGFSMVYDTAGTAQVLDADGFVLTPGTRVQSILLDSGATVVLGGLVDPGAPDITVATIDFLARSGDQYPFRGAPFTSLGVSYQQALSDYITMELSGVISAVDYPEGGEGRIATP
jgi:2',3'-cyclic-nucleotide 2'-phosphodiesterase (5'-nucleotidase family)/predicted extracellular nuclease